MLNGVLRNCPLMHRYRPFLLSGHGTPRAVAVSIHARTQVEWSEPWIVGVLCFHVSTFLLILLTRRWVYAQAALLLALGAVCFAAERINEWAAANHGWAGLGWAVCVCVSASLVLEWPQCTASTQVGGQQDMLQWQW